MIVFLSFPEVLMAGHVALMRNVSNIFNGRKDRYGQMRNDWTGHIEGACKEFAVAKATKQFWSGNVGNLKSADVGSLQVRGSEYEDGRLILHPEDRDDDVFVLVTGAVPNYVIRGWIKGCDGKRPEFWCDPTLKGRPAFFVPQSELRQLDDFVLEHV